MNDQTSVLQSLTTISLLPVALLVELTDTDIASTGINEDVLGRDLGTNLQDLSLVVDHVSLVTGDGLSDFLTHEHHPTISSSPVVVSLIR